MEDKQQKQDWQIGKLVRIAIATSIAGPALASLLGIYSIHNTQSQLSQGTSDYGQVMDACSQIDEKLVAQEEVYFLAIDELDSFARVDSAKLSEEIDTQVGSLGTVVESLGDEEMQQAFDALQQTHESYASGIHESLKTAFKTRDPSSVGEQVDANMALLEERAKGLLALSGGAALGNWVGGIFQLRNLEEVGKPDHHDAGSGRHRQHNPEDGFRWPTVCWSCT